MYYSNFIPENHGGNPQGPPHHMGMMPGFHPPPIPHHSSFDYSMAPSPFFPPPPFSQPPHPHHLHPHAHGHMPHHPSFENLLGSSSSSAYSVLSTSSHLPNPSTKPTLTEVFDDLSSRFVINIPQEELESFERLLFQIEAAHWFYDDFYREDHPELPKYNMAEFTKVFFNNCSFLQPHQNQVEEIVKKFSEYKTKVPVFGAIILNEDLDKALFVKGFSSTTWGFPKGKVNKDEPDHDCAIREVYEETGFDCTPYLNQRHYIEVFIKEQKTKLYIVAGVPESTVFQTRTRKEISKIEWISIDELPNYTGKNNNKTPNNNYNNNNNSNSSNNNSGYREKNFYRALPFFHKLKRWIANRKARYTKEGYATTPYIENSSNTPKPNNSSNSSSSSNVNNNSNSKATTQQTAQTTQIPVILTPQDNPVSSNHTPAGTNSNTSQNVNKVNYSPYPISPPQSPRETNHNNNNNNNNNSTQKPLNTPFIILKNPNSQSNQQNASTSQTPKNEVTPSNTLKSKEIAPPSAQKLGNLTSLFTEQMKQYGINVDEPVIDETDDYPKLPPGFDLNNLAFQMNSFNVNELMASFNFKQ